MNIEKPILEIIEQGNVEEGSLYYLPSIQLDRKTYLAVNKVLENLGGKWNRKQKAHVFDSDISDRIDNVLLTGSVVDPKKEFQFFETPPELAERLVDIAEIRSGESILEPSAGRGVIAKQIRKQNPENFLCCVELNIENSEYLYKNNFFQVFADGTGDGNFLKITQKHDVIIANPPFAPRQADIDHVSHMIDLANRIVISVMGAGVKFRQNKKTLAFWDKIRQYDYEMIDLPSGTFKTSGTMVNAIVLKVKKNE
ncbi:methyltransferase [bacterium]|nr:methyltransferase [bacterium]